MKETRAGRLWLAILTTAFIGTYFFWLTRDAWHSYFGPDACMTLYWSWANSATVLWKGNLLFFLKQPFFRPMTSVWFRIIYDFFGFNPLAFHIASLIALAANIWLTYCVSRRLAESRETGALAALLIAYHGRFLPLYFDTGHSYDVTCYFFYFSAFLLYLQIRSRDRLLKWWELVLFSALYICAFNCKELAVTLPLFLAIYEWLYHRPSLHSVRDVWRWVAVDARPIAITGVLTLGFAIGRVTSGQLGADTFQPLFTWARFMETSSHFVSELLSQTNTLPRAVVLLIMVSLAAIGWAARSRVLKFAWLFLMLSPIPVAFISPRGAGQYYIPYFGWVLYAAAALAAGSKWLFEKLHAGRLFLEARPVAVFLGAAAVMYWTGTRSSWTDVWSVAGEGEQYRSIVQQLHQLRPTLRPHSRVLFLDDPLDDPWQFLFLVQLSYRDADLEVDRAKFMQRPPSASEIAAYDYVFDYRLGRFYSSPQPRRSGPQPALAFELGNPMIYHADWARVTPQNPLRPGEAVITAMVDLGETQPPVPKGQPFPASPFLELTSPLQVRVDGTPAEILLKIGWPERVNVYRVDFRIPANVRSEQAIVEVTSGAITGPGVPVSASGRSTSR